MRTLPILICIALQLSAQPAESTIWDSNISTLILQPDGKIDVEDCEYKSDLNVQSIHFNEEVAN